MTTWHFWLGVIGALCLAVPPLIIFAMPECLRYQTQAQVDACIQRSASGVYLYLGAATLLFVVTCLLQMRSGKWTPLALIGLALGPNLVVVVR